MFPEEFTATRFDPGANFRTIMQEVHKYFNPQNTNTSTTASYPENGWRTAPAGGNVLNAT